MYIEVATVEQAHKIFDKVCRREMGMTREEVLELYHTGQIEWIDPDNMGVFSMLSFGLAE